jgi:hypothetical protein
MRISGASLVAVPVARLAAAFGAEAISSAPHGRGRHEADTLSRQLAFVVKTPFDELPKPIVEVGRRLCSTPWQSALWVRRIGWRAR